MNITALPPNPPNDAIGDVDMKKKPYSPPVVTFLERAPISGGTRHLDEGEGTGFFS